MRKRFTGATFAGKLGTPHAADARPGARRKEDEHEEHNIFGGTVPGLRRVHPSAEQGCVTAAAPRSGECSGGRFPRGTAGSRVRPEAHAIESADLRPVA